MQTKYDVGQTVLLKVKVAKISITPDGIEYSILMAGKVKSITVPEEDIAGAVEEKDDGD